MIAHLALLSCVLLALGAAAAVAVGSAESQLQRTVTGGMIEGTFDPLYTEASIATWKGVPFAAPPVGDLRFAAPAPVQNWTGVKSTKQFSPGCIATCSLPRPEATCTPTTSEDCLYLNVFSPVNTTGTQLPVMFFIHGGAYITGSAGVPLYEAAGLAHRQNIVVVTANYRLGMIGALYTGTVEGNFQTMDQRMTLRWIQDNIAQFGGDPNRVTLAGESAGGISVSVHLVSPKSSGLFHAAIMSSNPYGLPIQNPELATKLGDEVLKKLSCPKGGAAELACLRSKTAEELLVVSNDTRNLPLPAVALMAMLPWVPVAGTDEIPLQPLEAVQSGNFTRVPVYMGNNGNDSVLFVNQLAEKPLSSFELDLMLGYIYGVENAIKMRELYGKPSDKHDTRIYLSHIATDYIFFCSGRAALRGFYQYLSPLNISSYQYVFSHLPSFSAWIWNNTDTLCQNYVCHADDLPFVFGSWYALTEAPQPTADEVTLTHYMQDAYGAMTRQGNLDGLSPSWPAFTTEGNEMMALMTPVSGPVQNYQEKYCAFWDTVGYNHE